MSKQAQLPTMQILGLPFFHGTVEEAVERTLEGALVLAPSGPGLATLDREPDYFKALLEGDILLVDSGFLALLWQRRTGRALSRISGLRYLKALLAAPALPPANKQLWVMPTEEEAHANRAYLSRQGITLEPANCYLAPFYEGKAIHDRALLARIQAIRPELIVVNVAGGKQELLGAWLKRELDYTPAIVCTGAAIAFLTGRQASIPDWVDRAKLGWLHRVLFNPGRYLPRYLAAWRLAALLRRFGENSPSPE